MAASRLLHLCALLQALGSAQAFAPPWTITKYFEASVSTLPGHTGRYGTYPASEYTETTVIVPTVTSPRATTTITTTNYRDITVISIGLEPSQGTSSTYDYYAKTQDYYIPLTYTYPSSCSVTSGESTITTTGLVSIPTEVQSLVTPTLTSVSTSEEDYIRTTYRYTTTAVLLNPTDLPSKVYSSVEAENTPREIRYCKYYSGYGSGSGSSSSSGSSHDSYCYGYYGCRGYYWPGALALALIITFCWFGVFFIIGLIESAIRFSRLMRGRGASRGLPKSFACLCPLLSCLFIICMHRGYRPKPKEEQEELERNWKSMSFSAKFALWLKYGFSRSYPPMLGAAPPLATDPIPTAQPQMAQQPVVPGVMPPLPQQMGPQPLPQQTDQQTERHMDNQQPGQQPDSQYTEQQSGAPQREYEPLPVPAPYQPLPAVAHSSNNALFEQPGQAVSTASGNGSSIPHQTEPTRPHPSSHEQHLHAEQSREAPIDTAEVPASAPKAT